MASIRKTTRSLFFVTSPRTPDRMIPEIELLGKEFSGRAWNSRTQTEFYTRLSQHLDFAGALTGDLAFKARDRINRAPKALGFVRLNPVVELTPAGEAYLSAEGEQERSEVLLRQLLKFQVPSPNHSDPWNRFWVKPYLELLRLIRDADGLSKIEIQAFGLSLIDYRRYDQVFAEVLAFRDRKANRPKIQRYGEWLEAELTSAVETLYREEIASQDFKVRESSTSSRTNFVRTKMRNLRDYADAAIRYLRATGLISMNPLSHTVSVFTDRREDVDYILDTVARDPDTNESRYLEYLGDADNLTLLTDNPEYLETKLAELGVPAGRMGKVPARLLKQEYSNAVEKAFAERLERDRARFRSYDVLSDVVGTYDAITDRTIFDAPLFLEWNTWRSLEMINHGEIEPQFRLDIHGEPLATAPGNRPDLICRYGEFDLIVEVTMSTGQRQYEMEGEPVARHLGNYRKDLPKGRSAYCLFLAPRISEGTLAHFFMLHRVPVKAYGGTANVVPLDLGTWKDILKAAGSSRPGASRLQAFFEGASAAALSAADEEAWFQQVKTLALEWIGGMAGP